jgi:hypothetical protein
MSGDVIFKKRIRAKDQYINTSLVLLYCYPDLSDAAKVTYQIIDSFDWESKGTGESKGYVFPSIDKLAQIRGTSKRTIFLHIQQLEKAQLLTRERRRNKPSILYIEDVSKKEYARYEETILGKRVQKPEDQEEKKPAMPTQKTTQEYSTKSRSAKNCSSQKAREVQKIALAYNDEIPQRKHNEINVNENLQKDEQKKPERKVSVMQGVGDILKRFDPVNKHSAQKPKIQKKPLIKLSPNEKAKRDYLAQEMADSLGDQKSLGAFRVIAQAVPEIIIRDYLASVKETWKEGKIKQSRGALFISMIRQYSEKKQIDLGFKIKGGVTA